MQDGYNAIIKGNKLNWVDIPPKNITNKKSIAVRIIIDKDTAETERGKQMADALEQIAKLGGVKSIKNPVAWQKFLRKDRKIGM
ncbi:MAG: hypothetical protein NTX22_17675 [Ignavibacteriales bacterium]|nr:hypothetical protein [Ignavibacteriales bacterium]